MPRWKALRQGTSVLRPAAPCFGRSAPSLKDALPYIFRQWNSRPPTPVPTYSSPPILPVRLLCVSPRTLRLRVILSFFLSYPIDPDPSFYIHCCQISAPPPPT